MHPFIKKAIELEALKFGDFTLKSGLKSEYFFNIASFFNSQDIHFLANQYFKVIQKSGLEFDAMYGPAYKGIPLATAIGQLFYIEEKKKIELIFDRKEIKDHGEGGKLIGNISGKKILIIDDVLTAGTAIKETVEIIQHNNAKAVAAIVALDRMEKDSNSLTFKENLEKNLSIPILSITTFQDLKK
tara:strand:- start:4275 stop:4832 length:558 start_codon:yes stop_codon:yes gene_type:complete